MRVVIVTESFPPDVNGVAHCALQTARHLVRRGHTPLVIAPAVADQAADAEAPCAVVRVPSLPLPGYPQVRVALPSRRVAAAIAALCQTVQEAMASGVPVIAPAAGGPLDLVDHGRTGILVPPGDPSALRTAVASLAASPELRAAYGLAGRAAVEGRTWEALGDELIGHYLEVLRERTAVAA
ncbi:glycosyltransferase [Streptomyces sp. P9-A4]|uniref:glycosyltransferase n=1 Tax=Streptomyces sp. P9-A4 TaxID=3072285 RepID=UPI002FC88C50